ncbi:response regulator transcription factor [Aureliella helgolandensis]|uniref:Response regulator protein TmoT n=1 Tax=Aureliella helgolandensis TaxID=2527968 RepID=A0A518G9U8_9BACT|nr:response regulator [Aureliella helgolandensis]QDV25352.1 Response regulator protein TmoT [Aureliella helgolandensis]
MSEPAVFVIDDDENSRNVVVELVRAMQLPVSSFASAEDFLASYAGQRPACIVTDQRMPGMSGIDLIECLRKQDLTIPVVVVTAFADTQSTVRAVRGGAISLIEKPCNRESLWGGILEAIRLDQRNSIKDAEREDAKRKMESLTPAEAEVAEMLVEGLANKVVASRIDASLRTVEARRAATFKKLGVASIAGMVQVWLTANSDEP